MTRWVVGLVLGLAVVVAGVWIYLANDKSVPLVGITNSPATRSVDMADAPPNVPALTGFDVEVCGWMDDPAAMDCFKEAVDAGRGAELFSRNTTVEGDPIYSILRSDPDGGVVEFIDSSQDQFAVVDFYHWICNRVLVESDALIVGGCQGEEATKGWSP